MIKISGLTKQYNKKQTPAVNNLNLEINNGEIVGFAGLNGAGKTTTIRIIGGITFPTNGSVLINNHDIVKEKIEASKHIGWVPELPNFEPNAKSVQLIKYYAGFYGISSRDAENMAEKLLKKFNIWDARNKKLKYYSQGMKKRFSIVASLIGDPDNFLFDETLNGLDPEGVKSMRDFMLSLKKDNKAVFLSSHILSELENVADRIAIIKNGKLIKVIDRSDLGNMVTNKIKIKIKNPDDNIINILNKFGRIEINGNTFTVNDTEIKGNETYKINELLVKSGYNVLNITSEENFEDYFLGLMGENQ